MNNTDKLLRALIDDLGFDVEEVVNENNDLYEKAFNLIEKRIESGSVELLPLPMEFYTTDYKLTKMVEKSDPD